MHMNKVVQCKSRTDQVQWILEEWSSYATSELSETTDIYNMTVTLLENKFVAYKSRSSQLQYLANSPFPTIPLHPLHRLFSKCFVLICFFPWISVLQRSLPSNRLLKPTLLLLLARPPLILIFVRTSALSFHSNQKALQLLLAQQNDLAPTFPI